MGGRMSLITKLKSTIAESRENENIRAEVDKQNALIELLAILNGVDLTEDEQEGGAPDEQEL